MTSMHGENGYKYSQLENRNICFRPFSHVIMHGFYFKIEKLLVAKEEEIKSRSKAVEKRWFFDTNKTSGKLIGT